MNIISYIVYGLGVSFVIGIPFILWALRKGRESYAKARLSGMAAKRYSEKQLEEFFDKNMIRVHQNSRYWKMLEFSKDRREYEKKLEMQQEMDFKKLYTLSFSVLKPFFSVYYNKYNELYDLKMILYCVDNKKDKSEAFSLLRTKKYSNLLKYNEVSDIINALAATNKKGMLDFNTYNKNGLFGLEYMLDSCYFSELKKHAKDQTLARLYRIIRNNYILKHVIRLKEMGFNDRLIAELLNIRSSKEKDILKKDVNMIIKSISDRDENFRKQILTGKEKYKALDKHFQNRIITLGRIEEKKKLPFSIISPFNMFIRISREISYCRNMWSLK
ncbi:MAG: V-type ATPase subunit [Nanoarchaeota archaeon]|nr:V-type ATPase subunit [Nanoarchaeota archaeon]